MAKQTSYASQFLHPFTEPLDASDQVQSLNDLQDSRKVSPYKGKIVHVQDEGKLYLCIDAGYDEDMVAHSTWTPLFKDDGTAFYLRAKDSTSPNDVFELSCVVDGAGGKGRIEHLASPAA